MYDVGMLISIVIPSRNEKYLQKTIQSLLDNARGDIEILAVLDGYWCKSSEIVTDARVNYIHFPEARGMRNAINSAVEMAKGEYILKTDAHCMFALGYDVTLQNDLEDDWIAVPRRYRLDPEKWEIIKDDRPPIDYMYLDDNLKGREDREKNLRSQSLPMIDDLMTSQGSCWFMKKSYYKWLELLDEKTYGSFFKEFQEIGLKCWLSGGRVIINKNTWYAHWHKTEGRGYSLDKYEDDKASFAVLNWKTGLNGWHKQKYKFEHLIQQFLFSET